MSPKPTFEQAQLHLQVFEQRREARLRQARDWFMKSYFADNWADAMKLAAPGTEGGTNFMMVVGYWEQACALLNYGLLHDDLFFETSGEFFGVWERIRGTIAEGRQQWANPTFLKNIEQAAERFEAGSEKRAPGHIAKMRDFMKQMRSQMAKAA
jgi:hypothetical protein